MQFPKWQWTLLESVLVAHFFAGKYGIMVSNERQRSSAPAGRSQKRKGEASLGSLSLWSLFAIYTVTGSFAVCCSFAASCAARRLAMALPLASISLMRFSWLILVALGS